MIFFDQNNYCLYHGDTLQILEQMPNDFFNMVFADPPYFLSTGKGKVKINGRYINFDKGNWDKVCSEQEKDIFNYNWLSLCWRKLKDDGTIWVTGTYHNIFSVAKSLQEIGFKILNVIVWHKSDPPVTLSNQRFNFSAEYIIWARKSQTKAHYFNCDLMKILNGGVHMPDVWKIPSVGMWEKKCGKHPTQKPLRLLYRIILASTKKGDTILDPFAGSCTTGIAANLLGRKFIGIDQELEFLELGKRRKENILDSKNAEFILKKMSENPEETMVLVNHARRDLRLKMIEKGICYLRAGDSKGSVLVTPGFERMNYVLLHTNGEDCQMFKLKKKGCFQIWTKETLFEYGFDPQHAPYYVVLHFDNNPVDFKKQPNLKECLNTYRAKIRPLSDFVGIK